MAHTALVPQHAGTSRRPARRRLWVFAAVAVVAVAAGAVFVRLLANPFYDPAPAGPPPPPRLCPVQLPNGSTPVTLLEQASRENYPGGGRCYVRFESPLLNGIDRPVPPNLFRGPTEVYWYPAFEDEGYLRLAGSEAEVIVDLTRGATLEVTREPGEVFAVDVGSGRWPTPADRVQGVLAESPGLFIGTLEPRQDWIRFFPARDDDPRR